MADETPAPKPKRGNDHFGQYLQQNMTKNGPAGAKAAFMGLPGYFRRGSWSDSTPHGSGGGMGENVRIQPFDAWRKKHYPDPVTPAPVTGGEDPALAPQAAMFSAAVEPAAATFAAPVAVPQRSATMADMFGGAGMTRTVSGQRKRTGGAFGGGMF